MRLKALDANHDGDLVTGEELAYHCLTIHYIYSYRDIGFHGIPFFLARSSFLGLSIPCDELRGVLIIE